MKKNFLLLSLIISFALLLILNTGTFAATYRDMVRIGLNYGTDAVSSVQVSAEKGMDIGFYNNESFSLLLSRIIISPL